MTDRERGSAELRNVFGSNLRKLARNYPSVSALCRQLGINRTQFNRYLSGESYPRPDVLDQICRFFDVDARILLRPLERIENDNTSPIFDVFTHINHADPQAELAEGFYFVETTTPNVSIARLLFVRHIGPSILLKGFAPAKTVSAPKSAREICGFATHNGQAVYALMARQNGNDQHMMVLEPVEYPHPAWSGYIVDLAKAEQVTHAINLHFIGRDWQTALRVLRTNPTRTDASDNAGPEVAAH